AALDALDPVDAAAQVGVDAAADERLVGAARVHDHVAGLGEHGGGGPGVETVEQAAQQHQQRRDERQDHRRGDEAPGPAPQLPQRELHPPTPEPVVASIGSIASTRRAANSVLSTPSASSSPDHAATATGEKVSGMSPMTRPDSGQYSRTPSAIPATRTPSACTSSDRTSAPAGTPTARSSVSEPAFCRVTIRKKSPVTSGTTSAKSRKISWNDCRTCATPGLRSAASARVSASASGTASLMRSTSSAAVTPSAGSIVTADGSAPRASGFAAATVRS